jgi:sec-independent protein translocase protein TatC
VVAAAITPTVDPINMMLVWIPLVALYFLSVGTASLAQRQRARRLANR